MEMKRISYAGWEDCVQITHQDLTLIITTQVGPRVISCSLKDKGNLFYVHPEQAGSIGGNSWKTYGGHRLWCAPEDLEFTYAPDNFPVQVTNTGLGIRFAAAVENSGILKIIVISPVAGENRVRLEHIIHNLGKQTFQLAPWALTVMREGGVAVIPHNLDRPFQLLPTHNVSLWGYTEMNDPRWHWGKRYIRLQQDPGASTPQKVGLQNPYGWAGYAVNKQFFLKRFAWLPGAQYPDFNVNFEAYTNQKMLELESLAPLVDLKPGDKVMHSEEWFLYRNVQTPQSEADVDKNILPLIEW